MKKRNIAVRLGITAMALTLVTTSLSSGTLAKYTSTTTGTATVQVAQWDPTAVVTDSAGGELINKTKKTFDLRDTVLADTVKTKTLTPNVIGPGTEGKFQVVVKGSTDSNDVAIDYKVYINPPTGTSAVAPPPTHFHFWCEEQKNKGGTTTNGTNLTADTKDWMSGTKDEDLGFELMSGTIPAGATGDDLTKTCTMHWLWPYESGDDGLATDTAVAGQDEVDTGVGAAAASNGTQYKYTITVMMVQHDPNAAIS